ncbi:MAG: polysaccharide deacetylase family protein [Labilithrix sp.]|nr:polysaccharide deacetylase family protein [Labilithrix sp.]
MNKRQAASTLAARLKLTSVLERIGSRPALAVLIYHRISKPEGHRYDTGVIEATPEQFDEQMGMLKKRHAVLDPDELTDVIVNPRKLRHLRVAVTFDDAYRDNYDHAFPILASHGLRATFFAPTHYLGTRYIPWWDQIAWAVRSAGKPELRLTYPTELTVRVDQRDPEPAIRAVIRAYTRGGPELDLARYLAAVEEACELRLPAEVNDRQFMSWEEAREMERGGMAIGSHTHSHGILANMSAADQKRECEESRARLKEGLLSAETLAYPVGNQKTFSATTIRCAREAGYRCAFSNYGGINVPEQMNPFDVRRIGMSLDVGVPELRMKLAVAGLARRELW